MANSVCFFKIHVEFNINKSLNTILLKLPPLFLGHLKLHTFSGKKANHSMSLFWSLFHINLMVCLFCPQFAFLNSLHFYQIFLWIFSSVAWLIQSLILLWYVLVTLYFICDILIADLLTGIQKIRWTKTRFKKKFPGNFYSFTHNWGHRSNQRFDQTSAFI